jgi:hypothetical protein
MQITVTEFKRRLKTLKFAEEPIHITKRGKYMGVYVSEVAKSMVLAEVACHRDSLIARGFTPHVMLDINRQVKLAAV